MLSNFGATFVFAVCCDNIFYWLCINANHYSVQLDGHPSLQNLACLLIDALFLELVIIMIFKVHAFPDQRTLNSPLFNKEIQRNFTHELSSSSGIKNLLSIKCKHILQNTLAKQQNNNFKIWGITLNGLKIPLQSDLDQLQYMY